MAVAHDASNLSPASGSNNASSASFSWTHTPVGTPRGVLVFVLTASATTDLVTGVTYGGVAMARVTGANAVDTGGEPGRCIAYFLGSGIPTGAQTVVVSRTNNATGVHAFSVTVTAANDTEATGVVLLQEDGTFAEQSVDDGSPGVDSVRYACAWYGITSTSMAAGANSTMLQHNNQLSRGGYLVRETTAGQGARSVGFATGASDDRAAVHLAIREVAAASASGPLAGERKLSGGGILSGRLA